MRNRIPDFSQLVVCNSCPTVFVRKARSKTERTFIVLLILYAGASAASRENSSKKTMDSDTQTDSVTVSTREAGTQTEYDVIYITDLARYFHDIADKLGAGASLYSMQVS